MKTVTNLLMLGIILIGALLAGCQSKPSDVAKKAADIADFSVPEGYQPEMALDLAGYSIVSYNPNDGHSHLYLIQAQDNKNLTQEKLDEALSQAKTGKRDKTTRMTVAEQRLDPTRPVNHAGHQRWHEQRWRPVPPGDCHLSGQGRPGFAGTRGTDQPLG